MENLPRNKQAPCQQHQQTCLQAGFTLFELVIVLLILGLIMTLGLKAFRSAQLKARDSQRKSDLDNVADALELYYNDNGEYPDANNGQIDPGGTCSVASWGTEFSCDGELYMTRVPEDPQAYTYYYWTNTDRTDRDEFALYAKLENEQDPDFTASGYSGTDCDPSGASTLCNYILPSSNCTHSNCN